jgi:hypothetical protein
MTLSRKAVCRKGSGGGSGIPAAGHPPRPAPEPLKRVKVLDPFPVSRDGTAYWPNAVAEVPESVATHWLTQKWATEDE